MERGHLPGGFSGRPVTGMPPSGAMERMVKLVLGAFVLCALAMP